MANIILDNITINQPVADLTALAAIPTGALQAGVQVYVISVSITYEWSGAAWTFTGVFPPVADSAALSAIVTTGFVANKVNVLEVDTGVYYLWSGSAWVSAISGGADPLGTYLVQTSSDAPANAQVMGSLGTGLVKNTTTTGVQSIGADGTDYYGPATTTIYQNNGLSNQFMGNLVSDASAGTANIGYGSSAGAALTTGTDNTIFGMGCGVGIISGGSNTAVGSGAMQMITTESYNTAIGQAAMTGATVEEYAVAIGPSALATSIGTNDIAIGYNSLNGTGSGYNVAVGVGSFQNMSTGTGNNVGVGHMVGAANGAYTSCTLIGYSTDTTVSGLTNAGCFGASSTVAVSNAINIGSGCLVGINQPTPLAAVHVANVANSANVLLDTSTDVPAAQAGGGQLFVTNPNIFYRSSGGVISPLNEGPVIVELIAVDYTSIVSGPVVILPANAVNDVVIKEILIYATTGVVGGTGLIIESAVGAVTIFSFPLAILGTGAVVDQSSSTTTSGPGYYTAITNSNIQIEQNGTLSAGVINIMIKYQLQ